MILIWMVGLGIVAWHSGIDVAWKVAVFMAAIEVLKHYASRQFE